MAYTVTTNHHWREIVDASQLPTKAREEFDYLDWQAIEAGEESASFVRYRGDWYDLGDVMLSPDSIAALGYDGFNSDSYWSGVAFKFDPHDNDRVQVARIFCD